MALVATIAGGCSQKAPPPREPPEFLSALALEAARADRVEAVKDLLRRGVNPNTFEADSHDGDTLLIIACRRNNIELAKALLNANAQANLRQHGNFSDLTPLAMCAAEGHAEIVELLLEHGANVNARVGIDGAGPTALFESASAGHIGVVTLLLASGAMVGRSELAVAISKGHVEIVEHLLHAGGDPRWVLASGTVLEAAQKAPISVRAEMIEVVRRYLGS